MSTWLPILSMVIAVATFIVTIIRFGREVHVDDKKQMLERLSECERNHKACEKLNEELRKKLEESEQEKIRYMKLYLNANGKPTKGELG